MLNFQFIVEENNQAFFNEIASETARVYENRMESHLDSLTSYARHFLEPDILTKEGQIAALQTVSGNSPFYDIAYINLEGNAISASGGEAVLDTRHYFVEASEGRRSVSEAIGSRFDRAMVNVFAVPVYSMDRIVGVLAGAMEAEYLREMISSDILDGKAASYIMNRDGEIVIAPENNILDVNAGYDLFKEIFPEEGSHDPMATEAFGAGERAGSLDFTFNNENYFASYKSISINDWIVFSVAHSSDIYAMTYNLFGVAIISIVIFLAVIITAAAVVFVRSTKASKKIADAIAECNLLKNTDSLTGGPSFESFRERLIDILKEPEERRLAVISVDISNFRAVNDLLGHDEGNNILVKLADLLRRSVSSDEAYARKSADLFYMLLKFDSDSDIIDRIDTIVQDASYQITEFKLKLIFGVYRIDDAEMDLRTILDRADLARRSIKSKNENRYAFFNDSMLSKIREEKDIENIMEDALERNEFKVYLQPKYDLQHRDVIIGAEALVRWFRGGKMIPPGGFIPLFEKNGFILKIDKFVFEEVCKQQKLWHSRGYEMRIISVNMSRVNISDENFVRDLYDICTKYNVPTKYFEIEITESIAFENLEALTRVINELKSYGFHISIDDFGTGYSSLNMLKDLSVDVLKIDRAFLNDSGNSMRANNIISHVISLALSLEMKTICEGIETLEQATLLSELGCDMAQGYYFARPMPIEEYEKLLYGEKETKEAVTT
jgi:diguanylate cyclase (GGDEF)-like protein